MHLQEDENVRRHERLRHRRDELEGEGMEVIEDDEIPIDILENLRGRTTRKHVSDEAVGREIVRRLVDLSFCTYIY